MNKKNKLLSGLFVSNGMDIPFFIIMLGLMAFGLVKKAEAEGLLD